MKYNDLTVFRVPGRILFIMIWQRNNLVFGLKISVRVTCDRREFHICPIE